jgi:hypothetical protein
VCVDVTGRHPQFSSASEAIKQIACPIHLLHSRVAVADERYGELQVLEFERHTALLLGGIRPQPGTLAIDMMHAPFDVITGLLDTPSRWSASMAPPAAARPPRSSSATRTSSPG